MARKNKLYRRAHLLLILLICFTLSIAIFILNAPQKAGTAIARTNSTTCANGGATTIACVVTSPTNGNTLIASIGTRGTTADRVTSITQTNATWVRATQATNANGVTVEIWYANNISGASGNVTINLAASVKASAVIAQYSGVLTSSILDKTASSTGSGTTPSTGTTTTTSQSNQLWIGGMSSIGNETYSAQTNSFTEVAEAVSTGGAAGTKNSTVLYEKFVTTTGTASVSSTLTATQQWSGAIATFNATGPPTQIAFSTSSPTLTAGVCSSAITFQTRDSSGAPVFATNGVVIQISSNTPGGGSALFYTASDCSGSSVTSFTFNGSESSKTFYLKDTYAASNVTLTATKISGADILTDGTLNYTINPAALSKLGIRMPGQMLPFIGGKASGTPDNQTAGTSFTIQAIVALDAYDNAVTSYSGAKTLAFSGPGNAPNGSTPSYTTSVNFSSGTSTTTLTTTLYKAENTTLTVTDGGLYGSATNSFTVDAAVLNNFNLASSPSTVTAGATCSTNTLTITARDVYNNTRTNDTSTINLTASNIDTYFAPSASCLSYISSTTLAAGTKTVYWISFKKTTTLTLTATKNGDTITATTSNITVNSAAATFILTALPGQSFTDGTGITGAASFTGLRTPNATAGTSFNVTLYAVDTWNNLVDSQATSPYTGTKTISWASSTAGNAPSGATPTYPATSVAFTNGVSTTTLTATYVNATTSRTIRADDSGTPVTGTASSTFTVQAATVANYGVTATTPQTAGSAFNVTVTARDTYNNSLGSLFSAPAGTYTWSTTGYESPNNTYPSIGTLAQGDFTNGVATKSVTMYNAQSITFTATDPNSITGTSSSITINAGTLNNYGVFTNNGTAGTCVTTNNTIRAQDTWGNTVTGDTSTVNMTSSMTGVTFYTTSACTTTTTQYTLSGGSASFFFKTNTKHSGLFTANTMPSSGAWRSVTFGNNKYVAIASNSTSAAYSTDGITWSSATLPNSNYWTSVAYGGGKFVAVSHASTGGAAYSTDGITWSSSNLPSLSSWSSVVYGNGKFLAVAPGLTTAAYSTDGITWSTTNLPSSSFWQPAAFGAGKFIILSSNSTSALYSTDAITWSTTTTPYTGLQYATYGGGKFVAVAGGLNPSTLGAYSTDGITWTGSSMPSNSEWRSIVYGNGKYVAVAGDPSNVNAYSIDGINWTSRTDLPASSEWNSITYGNGKFVAVAVSSSTGAYLSETNKTITATKSADTPTGTSTFTLINPAATSTLVTKLPGQTFTDGTGISGASSFTGLRTPNATAGTAFEVTTYAIDAYNNLVDSGTNNYTGAKTISWANSTAGNAPIGTAPSYPATSVTFTNGTSTTTLSATYYNATTGRTIRADDTGVPVTGTASSTFTVQAAAAGNYNVSASTPQTAGVAFNVVITARDNYNNTLGSLYSAPAGTYVLSSTATNAPDSTAPSLGSLVQANFTNGVATKSVTLYKAESVTITAGEPSPSTVTGTTSSITVNPGSISANSSDSTVTGDATGFTNTPYTATITLKDTWRNPISGVNAGYITVSGTGSPVVVQPASNTDANGQTTATLTWTSANTYTVSVQIGTVTLVQDNGVTADADGFLDSTLSVTVVVPPASTILRGGTIIRGGTTIR